MKGNCLWDTLENPRLATVKIGIFILKVIVYGMKGNNLNCKNVAFYDRIDGSDKIPEREKVNELSENQRGYQSKSGDPDTE